MLVLRLLLRWTSLRLWDAYLLTGGYGHWTCAVLIDHMELAFVSAVRWLAQDLLQCGSCTSQIMGTNDSIASSDHARGADLTAIELLWVVLSRHEEWM